VVTQISASTAACVWMAIEWVRFGKPSALGFATGAIAGLAAVKPAAGVVGPVGGLGIGLAAGAVCYWATAILKLRLGYDDSLDVFGVHGVGGFVGVVLAAVFGAAAFGGNQADLAIGSQLVVQVSAGLGTALYTAVVSYLILKGIEGGLGLRVEDEDEVRGLDVSLHEESGYNL